MYALDLITAKAACVAAYAMKRLLSSYSGPVARFIRANDSTQLLMAPDRTHAVRSIAKMALDKITGSIDDQLRNV